MTNTLENAIYSRLHTDSDVLGVVGDRIYPDFATQNQTFPQIIYAQIDSQSSNAMRTASSLFDTRIQVDSWAKTKPEARDLANKVRTSLDGFIGTILGVRIWGVQFLNEDANYDGEVKLYRVSQDYSFSHTA